MCRPFMLLLLLASCPDCSCTCRMPCHLAMSSALLFAALAALLAALVLKHLSSVPCSSLCSSTGEHDDGRDANMLHTSKLA